MRGIYLLLYVCYFFAVKNSWRIFFFSVSESASTAAVPHSLRFCTTRGKLLIAPRDRLSLLMFYRQIANVPATGSIALRRAYLPLVRRCELERVCDIGCFHR